MKFKYLILATLLLSDSATAETMPAGAIAYVNRVASATENTIELNLKSFRPKLTPVESNIVKSIVIKVDKYVWNVFGTRAIINSNGTGEIIFTIGYIIAADYMDRAWIDLMTKTASGDLARYMDYVSKIIQQDSTARALGKPTRALKDFCEWSGEKISKCIEVHNSNEYYNAYLSAKVASNALVLGHEIGHHVKGHLSKAEARSTLIIEKEADKYGLQLALRSQQNPIFGIGPFLLFASFSSDIPTKADPNAHPPPLCRIVDALELGFTEASQDSGFVEYLKSGDRGKNWNKSVTQIKLLRDQVPNCP